MSRWGRVKPGLVSGSRSRACGGTYGTCGCTTTCDVVIVPSVGVRSQVGAVGHSGVEARSKAHGIHQMPLLTSTQSELSHCRRAQGQRVIRAEGWALWYYSNMTWRRGLQQRLAFTTAFAPCLPTGIISLRGGRDLYLAVREGPQYARNVTAALHRLRPCPWVASRSGMRQGQSVLETLSRKREDHGPIPKAPSCTSTGHIGQICHRKAKAAAELRPKVECFVEKIMLD